MRRTLLAAAVALVVSDALAGDLFTTPGMPVCDTAEHIRQYLQAVVQRDADRLAAVGPVCQNVEGGLSVEIIEDIPSSSELTHFVKIGITGERSGLAIGYSLKIGLTDAPRNRPN